ncbi:MAG: hypothetical protein JWO85_2241 [Candidatus Eremiobacteraeota bacterium]|nr:hypothetical protein [Candidatus Eremiobacteraeota bacterium]
MTASSAERPALSRYKREPVSMWGFPQGAGQPRYRMQAALSASLTVVDNTTGFSATTTVAYSP